MAFLEIAGEQALPFGSTLRVRLSLQLIIINGGYNSIDAVERKNA